MTVCTYPGALCERLRESAPGAARAAVLQHLAPQIAALPRLAAALLEAPSKYTYGVKHVSGGCGGRGVAGPSGIAHPSKY